MLLGTPPEIEQKCSSLYVLVLFNNVQYKETGQTFVNKTFIYPWYIPYLYQIYKGEKMVQAMIEIPEEANQILNIVKARYNLKTKSEAIAKIVIECGANILEPELRPEYLEKLRGIEQEGYSRNFSSIEQLRKKIEKK